MRSKLFAHLRAQWAGLLALFLVIAGGTAYAANTVLSEDIVDGEVKSVDIGTGQVRSADVRNDNLSGGGLGSADIANDSLSGLDIAESTLQNVNAGTVGGLQMRKINFQVPYGTGPITVLDLAGLQITAECQTFGDVLDVKAFTSKNDSRVYYAGISSITADDTDAIRDIASDRLPNGLFDVGSQLQIDNETPGDDSTGTLHYSAPDGSVVVVDLLLDKVEGGCAMTGIARGG
jgi:hypothetical protein